MKKRNPQDANVKKVATARRNTEARLNKRIDALARRVSALEKKARTSYSS